MKHTLKKKFISVIMALFIVLSYSISSVSSVAEAAEVGDGIETTDTSENSDSEYSDPDDFTGITERVEDATDVSDTVDTTDTTETTATFDSNKETDTSTEQGNLEDPANVDTSDKKDVSDKQDNESNTEVVSDSSNETNDNSDSLDAEKEDVESEHSLHALITERNSTAEVSVLTSADGADVFVRPTSGIQAEEGLEVIKAYMFAERADNPEDDIWVKADPNERVSLEECETLSLYTIKNNTVDDVIVEDISEDSAPYAIDEDVTGIALVKDTGYRHLNLELDASEEMDDAEEEEIEVHSNTDVELHSETDAEEKDDELQDKDKMVTLDGMMPKAVTAIAVDVTEKTEEEEIKEQKETATVSDASMTDAQVKTIVAAYDISLTDGDTEYQPDEEHPIDVEILDQRITKDSKLELWHIKDNGEEEQITDFTVEDGKVSFTAVGFSVYEIIEGPNGFGAGNIERASDLAALINSRMDSGFFFGYLNNYASNLLNSNGAFIEGNDINSASVWYFETISYTDDKLETYIYTYVNGEKKYINNKSGNLLELHATSKTIFEITETLSENYPGTFDVKKKGEDKHLQHSNGGKGIRFYDHTGDEKNRSIKFYYADTVIIPDDYYQLDGKTCGIMHRTSGSVGNALMADVANNKLSMTSVTVRMGSGSGTIYVAVDKDITMWTFHSIKSDLYYLTAETSSGTKYLKISSSGLELADSEAAASQIKVSVELDKNGNKTDRIKLSTDDGTVYYDASSGFAVGTADASKEWMHFVDVSDIEQDEITYSAEKMGVSEAKNGQSVIVYTRIWDYSTNSYEFYAIDHDGTLYPCYERGDSIMWVGDQINTLLWDFTVYKDDNGDETNYYELYNPYSDKYLAPLIKGNQVLSDSPVGINMPGRRDGEYYSTILAWDDDYYSYAGLKTDGSGDNKWVTSSSRSEASTFYFALPMAITPVLTTVETIDNNKYGITMKMKNFEKRSVQSDFLGSDSGGNDPVADSGLLSTDLGTDGYPVTARETAKVSSGNDYNPNNYEKGKSLGELFEGATEVNHLFIDSTYEASGYFEFDSFQNFATLVKDDGTIGTDFTVYKELGTMDAGDKPSLKHGQFMPYNSITPGVYANQNPENRYNALKEELPSSDPRKFEKLHLVSNPDYYNGLELEASFVQTPRGVDSWGHPIIFEFTGDDDFWLYVDGELAIDLGGIHAAVAGSINFADGTAIINGTHTTLREIFESNYRTRNPNATQAEVDAFLAKHFDGDGTIFKDYSEHTRRIFYMERGSGASNLHMRFNLSYITPGSVMLSKKVTGLDMISDDTDFSLIEYPYQIYYRMFEGGQEIRLNNKDNNVNVTYQNSTQKVDYVEKYRPPKATEDFEDVYFLSPDMVAEIHFPEDTYSYRIVECGVNTEVYDSVSVVGIDDADITRVQTRGNENRYSFGIPPATVDERKTVEFDNHVNPEGLRTLTINKKLLDENGGTLLEADDHTTFSFRLYLTNGAEDASSIELAYMRKYHVRDEHGNLCRWDATQKKFVSIEKDTYSSLSEAEKKSVTFETSMNGAISKIPAGYSVEIPGLPVGTIFKVEERDYEIPLGYRLVDYNRDTDTFYTGVGIADGDTKNSGRVRAGESPVMEVVNERGWEVEANKVWTDKKYTKSHDPIYFAAYIDDDLDSDPDPVLIPGSIKRISHPNTSVRFFFDSIEDGKTFEDYRIFEVEVTDPVVDDTTGVVTGYSSIKLLPKGEPTFINAVPKNGDSSNRYSYAVDYDQGEARKTAVDVTGDGNVREDYITNTRSDGVVITLYDMKTKEVISGGEFVLQQYDPARQEYVDIDTYSADNRGRITILYEFETDINYRIIENESPHGYVGLPNPVIFRIDDALNVSVEGNEDKWQDGRKAPDLDPEQVVAYIDIFNMQYTLQVYKFDGDNSNEGLSNAVFELYRGVKGGLGGIVKDRNPMSGYENLVTESSGLIPAINNDLPAGRYYLYEKTPPSGFAKLSGDIVFDISSNGGLSLVSTPPEVNITLVPEEKENEKIIVYNLNIPNIKNDVCLTVDKTVVGNQGSRDKNFTFTFTVDGGGSAEGYEWTMNDVAQPVNIKSGDTFLLSHGDEVKIMIPSKTIVTITENPEDYKPEVAVNGGAAENSASKTISLNDDTTLHFTNTRDGTIPTGVWMSYGILGLAGAAIFLFMLNLRRRRRRLEDALKELK